MDLVVHRRRQQNRNNRHAPLPCIHFRSDTTPNGQQPSIIPARPEEKAERNMQRVLLAALLFLRSRPGQVYRPRTFLDRSGYETSNVEPFMCRSGLQITSLKPQLVSCYFQSSPLASSPTPARQRMQPYIVRLEQSQSNKDSEIIARRRRSVS